MLTSEYTTPLRGKPYYRSSGIIKVYDRNNRRYSVGEITLERYDDQNFQYIIKPYWKSIDGLPAKLFQGIPGIDMSLKRDVYYRVNMTPAFISMRTPSEGREDVRCLMESVGLDYYDRFEWLLRSESKCGDDNLMVIRKLTANNAHITLKDSENGYLNPDNTLEVNSLSDLACDNSSLTQYVYQVLQSGVQIYISDENRYLNKEERKAMLYLLKNMLISIDMTNKNKRELGRQNAKAAGKYRGRKPIEIDKTLLEVTAKDFKSGLISEKIAMERLSLTSRSTFYRKLKTVNAEQH